ncbi:hypothetical protein FRC00_003418 [Tulasnella sp. 408]|nr:hypothetical protein FRC00_003418 [Tulasnella sp. 408]
MDRIPGFGGGKARELKGTNNIVPHVIEVIRAAYNYREILPAKAECKLVTQRPALDNRPGQRNMQSSKDWTKDRGDLRQADGTPQLPMELWIVVAEHLRHDKNRTFRFYPVRPFNMPAIKSLRLTSRTLNAVVEPLYWERVELSPMARQKESVEIIQHLHQNAVHREFIKCLLFSRWRPRPSGQTEISPGLEETRPPLDTLSEIFTTLPNLRAIHVHWSHMTCAMYEHLYNLQQLEYIEFAKPPLIPLEESLDFDRLNVTALRLKAITVSLGATETVPGVTACAKLFLSPSLEGVSTSSSMAPFIHALTNQKPFDQLRYYEAVEPLALAGFTEFYAFAAHCPNLTSVKFRPRITAEINEPDAIPSPPANVLTQLRCFDGTLPLAARIVPGRPVERVVAAFPSFHSDIAFEASLKRLSESSRPLKALNLAIRYLEDEYLSIISRIAPSLEELEISLYLHRVPGVGKPRAEEWLPLQIDTRLHLDQLKPLSRLRVFVLKNLQDASFGPTVAPEPFPEIAEGPAQIPAMKELCKNHQHLEYVELGQTVRWSKEHDCWVWRSPSESAVVHFDLAGSE